MDFTLELVVVPVSDVDRSKAFYSDQCGFNVDVDHSVGDAFRVVQLTPPGSGCSISIGKGLAKMEPGRSRASSSASATSTPPARSSSDAVWTSPRSATSRTASGRTATAARGTRSPSSAIPTATAGRSRRSRPPADPTLRRHPPAPARLDRSPAGASASGAWCPRFGEFRPPNSGHSAPLRGRDCGDGSRANRSKESACPASRPVPFAASAEPPPSPSDVTLRVASPTSRAGSESGSCR